MKYKIKLALGILSVFASLNSFASNSEVATEDLNAMRKNAVAIMTSMVGDMEALLGEADVKFTEDQCFRVGPITKNINEALLEIDEVELARSSTEISDALEYVSFLKQATKDIVEQEPNSECGDF